MENTIWDVAVIGGGPSGMMAAGRAAELGAKVILIEKNATLGKKLLITGGGRCNVTNAIFNDRILLERFGGVGGDGKFLFSTFSEWSVKETLDFFHGRNMETKVENEGRVFPASDKAQSVWNVLVDYIKEKNVTVLSNSPVIGIENIGGQTSANENLTSEMIIHLRDRVIRARSVIIATGGTSHPETGSTGDAFAWLAKLGHKIVTPTASLVPLAVKEKSDWVKRLAGVSLTNIKLSVFLDGVKQKVGKSTRSSKILFTHIGVSGPTILNMSKDIGELLRYGEVEVRLDLLPGLDYSELNTKLQELFKKNDKKKFKNSLDDLWYNDLIPSSVISTVIELSSIDPEVNCNSVSREERLKLITLLKGIPIYIDHLLGEDKAIISSGGVSLEEIDPKTMSSKLVPNLYLVGDTLNIDRPSGGFSLQICWTTGFVAGTSAVKK